MPLAVLQTQTRRLRLAGQVSGPRAGGWSGQLHCLLPARLAVFPVRDPRWLGLTSLSSGSGHIKEVIVAAEAEPGDGEMAEAPGSPSRRGPVLGGEGQQAQVKLLVNEEGRYVCVLCHKTFKTVGPGAACGRATSPSCSGSA